MIFREICRYAPRGHCEIGFTYDVCLETRYNNKSHGTKVFVVTPQTDYKSNIISARVFCPVVFVFGFIGVMSHDDSVFFLICKGVRQG